MLRSASLKASLVVTLVLALLGCVGMYEPTVSEKWEAEKLVDQGCAYLNLGDLDRAVSAFTVSYELAPSAAALDGLGCAAFLAGQLDKAERYFLGAMDFDWNYRNAIANLALLYEYQGRLEEAGRLHQGAIEELPQNFRARNNFAVFLHEHGGVGEGLASAVRGELLKAEMLEDSSLILDNINKLERNGDGKR
ncbi:MAG: hypothetical protein GX589_06450 [Deltaproteobacteria bacterium]|nr:hypothetical protein [Deltaproteobacteria bacterium]